MNRKTLLLALSLATRVLAQQAAPPHATLKDFLDAADTNNLDRRISVQQREQAAAQLTQSWSSLLPSLLVQGTWTHNQYEAVVQIPTGMPDPPKLTITPKNQFDAVFRVDLPLVDTGRWFRTAAASASAEAAEQRELATRDQVKRQIVGTYYSLAAAKALVQSAKKSLTVAEAQLALQTTRVRTGVVTELDQMRAKAEVERTRQIVADATALVATTRRSLRTLSGLEANDIAELPQDDLHAEPPLESLEASIEELPIIKAAVKDALASGKLATLSQTNLVPIVGAQFTERLTNATGFIGRADSYNTGINLTWRLDGPTIAGIRVAQAQENVALLAIERQKLAARDQVNSDWQRLQATLIKVQATATQVQAAERAATLAKERYEAGVATQIDVIQSERDVFSAEVSQIQALTELASGRASLRLSTGQSPVAP